MIYESIPTKSSRTVKSMESLRLLLPTFTHKGTQGLTSGSGKLEKDLLLYLFFLAPSSQCSTSTLRYHALHFSKFRADRQHLFYLIKGQHSNEIISNTWIIFVHFQPNHVCNNFPIFQHVHHVLVLNFRIFPLIFAPML